MSQGCELAYWHPRIVRVRYATAFPFNDMMLMNT